MKKKSVFRVLLALTIILCYGQINVSTVESKDNIQEKLGIGINALTRDCPLHGSEIFNLRSEYSAYTWDANQHTLRNFREYYYPGCGCTFTVYDTNSVVTSNHSFSYSDYGHNNTQNTHSYKPYCYCGFTKDVITVRCTGGAHVSPSRVELPE